MKPLALVVAAISLCVPAATLTASPLTPNQPEKAYSDKAAPMTSASPYEDLFKQVQEKLRANGFDPGPVDGTFNSKTQAALAQFQLSRAMPASGALDEATLKELGVEPLRTTAAQETIAAEEAAPRLPQ